jgi:hypothetical protein
MKLVTLKDKVWMLGIKRGVWIVKPEYGRQFVDEFIKLGFYPEDLIGRQRIYRLHIPHDGVQPSTETCLEGHVSKWRQ